MQRHHHDHGRVIPGRASFLSLLLPHLTIALACAIIFLFFLDMYKQGAMNFMNNTYSKAMACALGFLALINCVELIVRKNAAVRMRKRLRRLEKRQGRQ